MLEQPTAVEQIDKSVENIPVPPMPQPVKSSSEILCELFGAFNATPPPLDDIKVPLEDVKKVQEKKHKKHSKKKSKKLKKKKRSSRSVSRSDDESRKKPKKSNLKQTSDSGSVTSKKKKKRKKLDKFSASDLDSDSEGTPPRKKKKSNCEDSSIKIKQTDVKIKQEKDYCNTIPELIQKDILKDAVSKIVDKVIDSTKLKKESYDNESRFKGIASSICGDKAQIVVKQEPNSPEKGQNIEHQPKAASESSNGHVIEENIPIPEGKGTAEKSLVFKHGELKNAESEKSKPMMGKIKIQNLKFSQVYEATVKQIEEEAKRKAEKYEEGEISETTSEEKSLTPSLHSSSESVVEITLDKPVQKKRKHRHHKKEKCHHQRKRSRSKERHSSHSRHRRSNSQKRLRGERQSHKSRSRERSSDRTKKRRISREKSRSRSRERSRDRTKERRRSRSRDRSREKRKDSRRSTVSRERSNDRTKSRRRSKDRSKSLENNKDRKKDKESVDRVNSREKNKDTSKERKINKEKMKKIGHHTSTRDKDKTMRGAEDKIDKQKLLEIARKNALSMMKGSSLVEQNKMVSITAGGKTVSELTDFCKLLSKKDAEGHESISSDTDLSSDGESDSRAFHHPFQLKDRNAPIVLNIRNSVALPVKSLQEKTADQARELRLQFPVSSGQHHRKTESQWIPVSPKRAEPLAITAPPPPRPPPPPVRRKRTFTDTPDPPMIEWRDTRREPALEPTGQFTGSTGVRVLTQAELSAGQQAWARRDQLQVAAPVNSGMGMALLQKMGWRPGEGLGKNKEGALQPLLLEVKTDKKGLVAQEELPVRPPHQVIRRPQRSLEGKHPVSLLNEYCSRRKYSSPCYELIDEAGPDHKKNFRFKVKVNGVEYTPAVGSPKKKQARAEAAEICLKELGILPMMK